MGEKSPAYKKHLSDRDATTTTTLMNVAAIVEKADEQVLPAVYLYIGASLRVSLQQLGHLTAARAIVQAICSPISGVLGDKYDRTQVVAAGCWLWAIMTAMVGLSTSVYEAMIWCAFNGLGLALVIPCISSLVADYHPSDMRGKAFGVMGFVSAIGAMAATLFATNIGGTTIWGFAGWRVAFCVIALVSVVTGILVLTLARDPRVHPSTPGAPKALTPHTFSRAVLMEQLQGVLALFASADVQVVLRNRSFQIIILQGIVGTMPWMSLSFLTLWLQMVGFADSQASFLVALFTLGCAAGSLLGGYLGDRFSRVHPCGRIFVNQLSVLLGLPMCMVLLKGLPWPLLTTPPSAALHWVYASVLLPFGLVASWCGCNNSAMFADIVPEHMRSKIYAFDRAFEGAVGACGLPLVGLTAEWIFGFERDMGIVTRPEQRIVNAYALSNALLTCLLVPWTLCLLFFTGLHWTYPVDKAAASLQSNRKQLYP